MGKKILIIVFVVFIALQFFQPTLPEVINTNPNDLVSNNKDIPEDVSAILKNSCYDCHSNETTYPWYSYISPVSLLVVRDIEVGKEELNFSNWEDLNKIEKAGALDDITGVIEIGEMPMKIYTIIHQDANLNDAERELLINWAEEYGESLFE